tara:strand:- start:1165 stop:1368 length:204 start_codon:yes stop_codon:yes gene_type:complete
MLCEGFFINPCRFTEHLGVNLPSFEAQGISLLTERLIAQRYLMCYSFIVFQRVGVLVRKFYKEGSGS